MVYEPPIGSSITLDFRPGYVRPDGGAVLLNFGVDVVVPPEPQPVRPVGTRISWQRLRRVDRPTRAAWDSTDHLGHTLRQPVRQVGEQLGRAVRSPWSGTTPVRPGSIRVGWSALEHQGRLARAPWINLDPSARTYRAPWGAPDPRDHALSIPWWGGEGTRTDETLRSGWREFPAVDRPIVVPWINTLHPRDPLHRNFWGRELYARICLRKYEPQPGGSLDFNLVVPLSRVDDGDHIHFRFDQLVYDLRCTQREPSGWRDNYLYQRPPMGSWPVSPKLKVWRTMNTAQMSRLSDNAPVEVFSLDLSADIDSWCWSFTARVPAASLPLVMPLDAPVAVEADINGYKWIVLIESWSESHSFARREYTIRGRSRSAMLAEPYAPARADSNEQATLARQLAEAELLNTGWTLDWGLVDWLVGTGALSYSNATPLKVIQQIAEAAGGRIISHRMEKQLIALPRLHSLPWTWGVATPDLGISDWVVRQLSREFQPNVAFNAVFVSGESQGVLCKVVRTGTAGDLLAPMVTDALITDVEPARERGRMIIGQSGRWSKEQLELPLTRTGSLPGLLEIGQLISMEERGQTWRGQVVGVKVSADFSSGFKVSQNIDVERYRGN